MGWIAMANYQPSLVSYAREVRGVPGKQAQLATIGLMLAIATTCSWAQSCENLQMAIVESAQLLEKASGERELDAATGIAQTASIELDDAARAALNCGCKRASVALDAASTQARAAAESDSEDFEDAINQAIRTYNTSLAFLRACAEGGEVASPATPQGTTRQPGSSRR
jgi:hypothetical protein